MCYSSFTAPVVLLLFELPSKLLQVYHRCRPDSTLSNGHECQSTLGNLRYSKEHVMENDFYTVKEFANVYGCSQDRVYEWLRVGKIKHRERLTKHAKFSIPKAELARIKGEEEKASREIIVQQPIHKEVEAVVMKQREDHFADLADVAKRLINGLENVSQPSRVTSKPRREVYLIPNENSAFGYSEMTKEQLSQRLNQNMKVILKDKDRFFRSCFVPHVKTEFPEERRTKLFLQIIEEQPFELIECLTLLAAQKSFKGVCRVCKDWHQPLTCPLPYIPNTTPPRLS